MFIAFLFVEFISWLNLSFSLKSCLFCSISLFKFILASLVLDKINEMISVLLLSLDRLRTVDVLSLFSWVSDFLPLVTDDWSKFSTTGNWANELLIFYTRFYLNFSNYFFNEVSFISNFVFYYLLFFTSSLNSSYLVYFYVIVFTFSIFYSLAFVKSFWSIYIIFSFLFF